MNRHIKALVDFVGGVFTLDEQRSLATEIMRAVQREEAQNGNISKFGMASLKKEGSSYQPVPDQTKNY